MSKKKHKQKRSTPVQCGTVTISPIVPVIGGVCLAGFLGLLVLCLCSGGGVLCVVVFGGLGLMSLRMLLTANERIDYTPQGFTYRDMLRIRHAYTYDQVKSIRYGRDVYIHVGHRFILIDDMAENGRKFARIAAQYAPQAKFISRSRLFGGHVASPGEFIFFYVLIALVIAGLAIGAQFLFKPVTAEELILHTGRITDYSLAQYDDSTTLTIVLNGGRFHTFDMPEETYAQLEQAIREGQNFQLRCEDITYAESIQICELSCGETCYVSLEDYNAEERETRRTVLLLCGALELLWLVYVAVSSYVMCHADRYPRLVRFFVKESHLIDC